MSYFPIKTREKTYTKTGNEFLYNKPIYGKINNISKYFSNRLVTNEQLLEAKPGIYTWILRRSGNFYAIKIITKQEIGTLHLNLKLLTDLYDPSDIEAAGELEIIIEEKYVPPTIIFNLLSGTYMVKKFDRLSEKDKLFLRNQIVENIQNILINFGIYSQFLECSGIECSEEEKLGGMKIIEHANIKTSPAKLEVLNSMFTRRGGVNRKQMKLKKTHKLYKKKLKHTTHKKINMTYKA